MTGERKKLRGWDAYVAEASSKKDMTLELPITDDEVYVIDYPSRRQGEAILVAQRTGDMDALVVALLGKEAGTRVAELSADVPAFVLDELLLDVMRTFGMVSGDEDEVDAGKPSATPASPKATERGPRRTKSSAA